MMGPPAKPRLMGKFQPHADGDASEQQTEHDAQENGDHVGLFERTHLVAEQSHHLFDAVGMSHHRHAVAHAQHEVGGGE